MLEQQYLEPFVLWTTVICTLMAAFTSTAFVFLYARLRWNTSRAGRIIMLLSVAVATRAWIAVVTRYDDYHPELTLTWLTWPLISIAWIFVSIVFGWSLYYLRKDDGDAQQ